jgi:hypothetical protein
MRRRSDIVSFSFHGKPGVFINGHQEIYG